MKALICSTFSCCVGLLIAGAQAQDATTTTTTYVPTTTVVGARVLGPQGDQVGEISDVILDKQSGCMAYVVVATEQGEGRKLVAAPWTIFSAGPDNRTYTVRFEKEKIYSAPVWESTHIAEYSQASWISNVYAYYGVQPQAGINIQSNAAVTTDERERSKTRTRAEQARERTENESRMSQEGQTKSPRRNPDMLTQPSPGRHRQRQADSHQDQTRADRQARREERRQRRAQRESSGMSQAGSGSAERTEAQSQGQSNSVEGRDRGNPSVEQPAEHRDSAEQNPTEQRDSATEERARSQSPNAETRQEAPSGSGENSNAEQHSNGEATHPDKSEHEPAAQASPTP